MRIRHFFPAVLAVVVLAQTGFGAVLTTMYAGVSAKGEAIGGLGLLDYSTWILSYPFGFTLKNKCCVFLIGHSILGVILWFFVFYVIQRLLP